MTREEIKILFENYKNQFLILKERLEIDVVKEEYSECPYYEITPYSYQRSGFKQGTLVTDYTKVKSKYLFIYGFDDKNQLITIKKGIDIKNQFYYQFRVIENNLIKIINFDNGEELRSIKVLIFDDNGQIEKTFNQGKFGAREEKFFYTDNRLSEIHVEPYGSVRRRVKTEPYKEVFSYSKSGKLEAITKIFKNGYSEVIYDLNEK